jgi:hypothetical protein
MMKLFRMYKIPVILLGLGAALLCSPACKAQSEIAPDHFDGSDSCAALQAPSQKLVAPKVKQALPASQARNHQTSSPATLQLAAKRDSSLPLQPGTVAIQDKRKPAARKPKKP